MTTPAIAVAGPSAFWFLTRGTGAVTLVLLTVTVALGVLGVRRTQIDGMPRFVLDGIHRNASLLAVTFLGVHIATALLDGFAPITLLDVVIPFGSAYRPLWIGFGAVAFDLMLAVAVTSLMRRRLGYGAWRATHWLAYASWPVALLHGLGTGSDVKAHWMLLLTAACVGLMLSALAARIAYGWPAHRELRIPAIAAAAVVPIGLITWLPSGPLGPGWAARAGTPETLLHATGAVHGLPVAARSPGTAGSSPAVPEGAENEHSFSAAVHGTVTRAASVDGRTRVSIALTAPGQPLDQLRFRIEGTALEGGGVRMSAGQISLGTNADPSQYRGQITGLQGSDIEAHVIRPGYAAFTVLARLNLQPGNGAATGTVTASAQEGTH